MTTRNKNTETRISQSVQFLPVNDRDMEARGWDELDFLLVTGDAYVDHPAFGAALIGRLLEAEGFRVGILPQPDWTDPDSVTRMGRPRLAALITAGNLDSCVAHYTASGKKRSQDLYTPRGEAGKRPDRATIVYTGLCRRAFPGLPVVIGGIEASLRRFAHYDFLQDKVRGSILPDSKADLLIYGMAEGPLKQTAAALARGEMLRDLRLPGTCVMSREEELPADAVIIPAADEVRVNKRAFASAFRIQHEEQDPRRGRPLAQKHGNRYLLQLPPAPPLESQELDRIYNLPFTRNVHPEHLHQGDVPAIEEVRFSLTAVRGCYGGCAFCSLHFHQGRIVRSRTADSILAEAEKLTRRPDFKGQIHDVGGPTANMSGPPCKTQEKGTTCSHRACLFPEPCPELKPGHGRLLELLRKIRHLPGVKNVFLRSGIRFDLLETESAGREFLKELVHYHVSGQLKVAPEHVADRVLQQMGKPDNEVYQRFVEKFFQECQRAGKDQYLVPYFITGHPGTTLKDAIKLAEYVRDMGYCPEQVQDFYPTPGTLSTCIFHTGLDPFTLQSVKVVRDGRERAMQRALLQYRRPENQDLVREALERAGRFDLIGYGGRCLVPPVKTGPLKPGRNSRLTGKRRK